ncbi:WecB/TagA/CpsF family glycosyltransferase [Armatimonas rosea]|uniref:N-acetylglucosaminyldiphosphoundecaprenol N-acetyl-beta-D-mannosaminyltransferase n=1 Tax=Armatimonas rosea TaxID=685828 RepID=A0A7W9W6B3_ARMRO|nr:WecB/TagA/CpsF family glycosyltransferase [Armatimonas rosea]MBB6049981.1 N-acetylglucosaminyldiphosphoundecaprenol N-acetyl-beta-D-mannosaminyltransferase [Armatimonas rosea]
MLETKDEISLEQLCGKFSPQGILQQRFQHRRRVMARVLAPSQWLEAKRATDLALAAALLVPSLPLFALLRLFCGPVQRTTRVGRWAETFSEYSFDPKRARVFSRLPCLLNILAGQMSFVGPRATIPGELTPNQRTVRRRYDVRPGLLCTWWIRQRANIGYDGESLADAEYAENPTLAGDVAIALRAIPAAFYGEAVEEVPEKVSLLDIPVDNLAMTEAVEVLVDLTDSYRTQQVAFVNADCANISFKNDDYRKTLQEDADMVLADGIGMKLAGNVLKRPIKQNVNGTDLFPRLCAELENTGKGLFLLGAKPGVAEAVANWVRENHPGMLISGVQHGYFSADEEPAVLEKIASSGASLLLVAFGAPRQDQWIAAHKHELGSVKVAIGVGGLFDFFSGEKQRAPLWLREMGMEWAFRLYLEPARLWKRYVVGNGLFLMRVLWWRITHRGGESVAMGQGWTEERRV